MTNRVILGEHNGEFVLRISRPGYDVLSPGLLAEQMVFDSGWSELSSQVVSGTVLVPRNTTVRVFYGVSLPYIPVATFMYRRGPNEYVMANGFGGRPATGEYIDFRHDIAGVDAFAYIIWSNAHA